MDVFLARAALCVHKTQKQDGGDVSDEKLLGDTQGFDVSGSVKKFI